MIASNGSHSALVTMELHAEGRIVRLTQLGGDFAIPAEAVDLPPGPGEVVVSIDGRISRMPVHLTSGASSAMDRITLQTPRNTKDPLFDSP